MLFRIKFLAVVSGILLCTISAADGQSMINGKKTVEVLFPFSIVVDPMERLLLINFVEDPDSIYVGFEPQVFNDTINGSGHLIIAWRRDKKIDVYHQKSLSLDTSKYRIAGSGLNQMIPVEMPEALFEIVEKGVRAKYTFNDAFGRTINISIKENGDSKRKPFGLLAPMGDAASNPSSLPLILLHDFYFVRKNQSELSVIINNKSHKLDNLPMRIDGQKMTFTRYSPKPLIASINPEFNGLLTGFTVEKGQTSFENDNCIFNLEWINNNVHIKSISVKNNIHTLKMNFSPPVPSLNAITENTEKNGKFSISGHESVGNIAGVFQIKAQDSSIFINLSPNKGWNPKITKVSTWFLFNFAKVFKKWPATYQWEAIVQKLPDDSWNMQSKWYRTGKIMKE